MRVESGSPAMNEPVLRNRRALSLHIPQPARRPGEHADFSGVRFPEPGEARRPELETSAAEMRDLAFSLIRVLAPDGEPVGPWAPALSDDELISGLRTMLLTRA